MLRAAQIDPNGKVRTCSPFAEPSDGLEPSTPSLPCDPNGNRWQPVAIVWRSFKPISGVRRAEPLPPVAPALFHNCSIPIGPKTGTLKLDQDPGTKVDRFCAERGSLGSLARIATKEGGGGDLSPQEALLIRLFLFSFTVAVAVAVAVLVVE